MQTDFKVRERGCTTVLAKALDVRLADIGTTIGASFAQVYGHLGALGADSTEPPFIIYDGLPNPGDEPFPIQICAPVREPVAPPAGWTLVDLPAGRFASVLHIGPYEHLGTAYDELEAWIARQALAIVGPPREIYLSDPTTAPVDIRTVIEFPVAESEALVPAIA